MKTCCVCKQSKDPSDFHRTKDAPDGHTYDCKACRKEKSLVWRQKNRGYSTKWGHANRGRLKAYQLKYRYGIPSELYEALLQEQGGVCAICRKTETAVDRRSGDVRKLAVDHDHETGKVRGLLCGICNTTLGKIKESFDTALNLAKYIQEHKEGS